MRFLSDRLLDILVGVALAALIFIVLYALGIVAVRPW